MAKLWQGVLKEYSDYMPENLKQNIVTLQEGGTPLIEAFEIEKILNNGSKVFLKYDGINPTGSFKDRGMTAAITDAVNQGSKAVVCASTGNTSASAAAYSSYANINCTVLIPEGKIAEGKLAQAVIYGAKVIQIDGNFDDCLKIARELSENYPITLVNSINPARMQGQKTASFEIIDFLGDSPDIHCIPVGNAGNITAYWMGYNEYFEHQKCTKLPKMWGFQAEGAAPLVEGHIFENPETIATAIRIGNPARKDDALNAVSKSNGLVDKVSDGEILEAQKLIANSTGVFCEPASAASIAGLLKKAQANLVPPNQIITATLTGNGLKDPQWALKDLNGPTFKPINLSNSTAEVANFLNL